jgi:hypothetical protein
MTKETKLTMSILLMSIGIGVLMVTQVLAVNPILLYAWLLSALLCLIRGCFSFRTGPRLALLCIASACVQFVFALPAVLHT